MHSKLARVVPIGAPISRTSLVKGNLGAIGALPFLSRVCLAYGVTVDRLIQDSRSRTACSARHHVWTVLRHTLDLSFHEIADLFLVDHSTVVHAVHARECELEELYS